MPLSRIAVFLVLLSMACAELLAQPANDDCGDASLLCAGQGMSGNNTGSTDSPGFCQGSGHLLWYTFTTNSVGGPVEVAIDAIQCPDMAGMNNELSVVVLSGDGSCIPGSFNAASICMSGPDQFVLTASALQPGTQYWIVVAGLANGGDTIDAQCGFNVTVSGPGVDVVNVDFDAGTDVVIPVGGTTQLEASGATSYSWVPASGLSGNNIPNPIASPAESTLYTVTGQVGGCIFSDTVRVSVVRLINPVNTFTPNGDGINDTWEIAGIANYPQADVSVYDRWGQRVYHSLGYKTPFDGAGLPTATYYWYIQVNSLKGPSDPYTGSVTIVR
jgi:gliding motility-associated-like protein